jgi:hypothetical protein
MEETLKLIWNIFIVFALIYVVFILKVNPWWALLFMILIK